MPRLSDTDSSARRTRTSPGAVTAPCCSLDGALSVPVEIGRGYRSAAIATRARSNRAARLRPLTRAAGLSLGDRACLALARRRGAAAITADSARAALSLDVEVRSIR